MNFVVELLVLVFTTYLSLTNSLAITLTAWFAPTGTDSNAIVEQLDESPTKLSLLPSQLSSIIPDVLLRSAEYQQAALAGSSGLTGATTEEPLEAIVNIFCTFTTDEYIKTTTGTGFFIDPDGVIITNAHVAQFLLLGEADTYGDTDCVVRSGNPATPQYQVKLLYLPPAWVMQNAGVHNDAIPMGTGERDYALLYVSGRIDNEPLPAVFPALRFDTSLLPISTRNKKVLAAGYPASDLLKNGPATDLIPQKAETTVSELYTFGSNYADVFSIRGSIVGAEGSSGGPVLNENGDVIGIIVTRGDDVTDGPGSLRAITLSHVGRTIREETGFTLSENLGGNLAYRADIFARTMSPFLVTILKQED